MIKLTQKDKKLLFFLGIICSIFGITIFLFLPALETKEELIIEVAMLEKNKIELNNKIELIDVYSTEIEEAEIFIEEELGFIPEYLANEDLAIKIAEMVVEQGMKTLSLSLSLPDDRETEEPEAENLPQIDALMEEFTVQINKTEFTEEDVIVEPTEIENVEPTEVEDVEPTEVEDAEPTETEDVEEITFQEYLSNAKVQTVSFSLELRGFRIQLLNLLDAFHQLGYVNMSSTSEINYGAYSEFSISGEFYMYDDVISVEDSSTGE